MNLNRMAVLPRAAVLSPLLAILVSSMTVASDWITAPSYYTHSPQTLQRVSQYAPIGPFYLYNRGDYMKSGYRHTRSSLQVGSNADHLHIVEEWGRPIRPYEEWRFPFRPYSVPYDAWGPQVPFGFGYGNGPIFPFVRPGFGGPQFNPFLDPSGQGVVPPFGGGQRPWFDGLYPDAPRSQPRF